jgi:hypothetical protein
MVTVSEKLNPLGGKAWLACRSEPATSYVFGERLDWNPR